MFDMGTVTKSGTVICHFIYKLRTSGVKDVQEGF
jgi:hypothetical protein